MGADVLILIKKRGGVVRSGRKKRCFKKGGILFGATQEPLDFPPQIGVVAARLVQERAPSRWLSRQGIEEQ